MVVLSSSSSSSSSSSVVVAVAVAVAVAAKGSLLFVLAIITTHYCCCYFRKYRYHGGCSVVEKHGRSLISTSFVVEEGLLTESTRGSDLCPTMDCARLGPKDFRDTPCSRVDLWIRVALGDTSLASEAWEPT